MAHQYRAANGKLYRPPPGNTFAMTHGLDVKDPTRLGNKVPVPYNPPTEWHLEKLGVASDYAEMVFDMLVEAGTVEVSAEISYWATTRRKLDRLRAQVEGDVIVPANLGSLTEEQLDKLRASYRRTLSGVLTQLRNINDFVKDGRVSLLTERGTPSRWVTKDGSRPVVNQVADIIKDWLALRAYEEKRYGKIRDHAVRGYAEAVRIDGSEAAD